MVDCIRRTYRKITKSHEWGNAKEQAEFLKEMEDTDRYKILLSHIPNTWMYYDTAATFDLDLIFTGHVHGGQVIFPFVGGLTHRIWGISREDYQVSIRRVIRR